MGHEKTTMRRTKIVCTLGPAVDGAEPLARLLRAGMDVARFNFSHGTYDEHRDRFEAVRQAEKETGKCVAVLQDLCGPKIRIGNVAQGTNLLPGQPLTLTTKEVPMGGPNLVHLAVPEMVAAVRPGQHLLLDDGLLELVVENKNETDLFTRVVIGGVLGSKKGISAPGVPLDINAVTPKDEADVRFGLALGVDYVALSFVRHADDVKYLRQIMRDAGRIVPIIVKIEKFEAVQNLETILAAADGAMVARGDLGVEMPVEEIAVVQKKIIRACNLLGKPVITATQMLDSMIRNPRPTRAEVTDIANAVLDGTDAVMLSGETAVGAYPFAAVEMMAKIAQSAESYINYERVLVEKHELHGRESVTDAIGEAVATIALDQKAAAIICSTASGGTARIVSKFKPRAPILAATASAEAQRAMMLYWGVIPLLGPPVDNTDSMIAQAIQAAQTENYVQTGDVVVVTAGTPVGVAGSTNMIKVHTIGQPLTGQA